MSRIAELVNFTGLEISNPQSAVEAFTEYFGSVFDLTRLNGSASLRTSHALVPVLQFFDKKVLVAFKSSRNTVTAVADFASSFMLRNCAPVLLTPLLGLYNLILQKSSFLVLWRGVSITPGLHMASWRKDLQSPN